MNTTLIFTPEQLALLSKALIELPYREAAPLIAAINQQIQEQRAKEELAALDPGHCDRALTEKDQNL